jgi:cell division transport system permease protein
MFIHIITRGILFACQSFWRNIWLSIATIFVVFLALLSVNFLIIVNVISDSAVTAVKDRIDVSVYFKPEVKEAKIAEVKTRLESLSQVKSVVYKSPQENLDAFKAKHQTDENIQETLNSLSGNPMGATLVIKAKDIKDYPEILKAIDDPVYAELIEEKNYDDNQLVIERIGFIAQSVRRIVLAISLIFTIISLLIIFNTVRIAIFTHQNEIAIMKLVGASNWFIRFPFIFESVISGAIAVLCAILFIYPLLSVLQSYLGNFFVGTNFDLVGYFNANFIMIFGAQIIAILIINVISSLIAISRYLNV